MAKEALHSYLRATRGSHCRVIDLKKEDWDFWNQLLEKAFPNQQFDITPVFTSSTTRRCEFLTISGTHFIIIDWELVSTVAQFDFLASKQETGDLSTMSVFSVFADEFSRLAEFKKYRFMVSRLKPDAEYLRHLATGVRKTFFFSRATVFFVLHELAHFAIKGSQDGFGPLRELVEVSISKFLERVGEIQQDPEILASWSTVSGIDDIDMLREQLTKDLPKYISIFEGNPSLDEELICDLAGVLAYINFACDTDLFADFEISNDAQTMQQVGDCMMMSAKALKGLQTLKSISTIAENIRDGYGRETLRSALVELTARNNIFIFLASTLYSYFCSPEDSENTEKKGGDLTKIWMAHYSKFVESYDGGMLKQVELVEKYFLDAERLDRDISAYCREMNYEPFDNKIESRLEADLIRFSILPLAKPL